MFAPLPPLHRGRVGRPPGPYQVWATADRPRGRRYELTIGDVGNPRMAARALSGDRRLSVQVDLAPFVEALSAKLTELLERPVFACCDSPQPTWPGPARPVRPSWTPISPGPWSTASIPPWPTSRPARAVAVS
jgi:hypothetical protein